jgi:hypothetical protein
MKLDRLNHWLNLVASTGVIVGLVFLIVELNQSNRIASYAAEHSLRNQWVEFNIVFVENSDVYARLQSGDAELSPSEQVQAVMMSRLMINTWKDAESAYNYGLLSDESFGTTLKDISIVMEEIPGLIPYFAYMVDAYELEKEPLFVSKRLAEVVKEAGY